MPEPAGQPVELASAGSRKSRRAKPAAVSPGDVQALAAKLGVQPRRPGLLRQALTHKSAEQELNLAANERLEFLGDAVLDLVLAEHLFQVHPDLAEGDLTKVKAVAVSEPVLAEVARELGVGSFLVLARGEEQSGGRDRNSILADAMEAIFAAVYLDRGLRAARELVLRLLVGRLHLIESREYEPDYKTVLQEKIQEVHRTPPTYRVVSQTGPDHDRTFVAEVRIGKTVLGSGTGKSKKQAEQAAAKQALLTQD
ncbi:MAG: ribonuclease III [Armatimonadota bacterium]